MDINEILKSIFILLVIFSYFGGFIFWCFIALKISNYFEKNKENNESNK